jgi:hypothetical protein
MMDVEFGKTLHAAAVEAHLNGTPIEIAVARAWNDTSSRDSWGQTANHSELSPTSFES